MNNFFICATSACMERMLDSQKIYSYLKLNGWTPVRKISVADLLVISTCAFGDYEDRCSQELIRHYLGQKKQSAKVIIVGCLPVINPSQLDGLGEFVSVPPTNLDRLDEVLGAKVRFRDVAEPNRIRACEVPYRPTLKKFLNLKSWLAVCGHGLGSYKDFLTRQLYCAKKFLRQIVYVKSYINPFLVGLRGKLFYVRISRGCLGSCSYCAKKFATGKLQSKAVTQILEEFKQGLGMGGRHFLLLTEDAGCYGLDIGTTIISLLQAIFSAGEEYDFKLIISNFNAEWFLKYYEGLETLLMQYKEKVLYVHIPIQSGSNRILRLMNRPYRIEDVERGLCRLRSQIPDLNISTDIMVGFPGETEDDFVLSKEFLRKVRFDFADIFSFERRPHTKAAGLDGQLPRAVIESRRFSLLGVQNDVANASTVVKKIVEVSSDFIHL